VPRIASFSVLASLVLGLAPATSGAKTGPAKTGAPAAKSAKDSAKSGKAPAKVASLGAGWAPPAYVAMVRKWHAPAGAPKVDAAGRPKLVLVAINRPERVELEPLGPEGGFGPQALERASWILRSADGQQHPVDPRLLDVAYALQRRFGAAEIRFLSGFRTPKRGASNHGLGRAIDLVVPGATDEEVAAFARARGFVGVGIYPTSGFVHVDVRDRSFFWVDRSGPGKPNRTVGILGGDAAASDARARKAGEHGAAPARIGRDVDAALAARARAVTETASHPTDDPTAPDEADDDH
jgi:uncharacterized protein YcbK (DUF882 family)